MHSLYFVFSSPRQQTGPCLYAFKSLSGLAEEAEQDAGGLVSDRQGLNTKLLLGLQSLKVGAFLSQIGVNKVTDRGGQGVLQLTGKHTLTLQGGATDTEGAELGRNAVSSKAALEEPKAWVLMFDKAVKPTPIKDKD